MAGTLRTAVPGVHPGNFSFAYFIESPAWPLFSVVAPKVDGPVCFRET
jgi:hypothetical protein